MVLQFLEAIFRDANDPVVLLAQDGTVATANPAFRALVQRGRNGAPFMELVSFHARDRVARDLVRAAAGDTVLIEVPHPREPEGDTVVEYRFFPVDDGMTAGIGRIRDAERALGDELGRTQAELRQKQRILDEIQIELTQVPFIDPATGVWNRLQVIERLAGEWSRSERWGSPIACLMVEVDDLEDLRRREGNALADEVLKSIARRIKTVVRDHDVVGRFGGGCFVVLAVHCPIEGARHLASRIGDCVAHEPVSVIGRTVWTKVRIGCCTNQSEGVEIMEDLFSVAQEALAEARTREVAVHCADDATA